MHSLVKTPVACPAVLAVAAGLASYASAEPYKKKRPRAPYAGKLYSRVYDHRGKHDSIAAITSTDLTPSVSVRSVGGRFMTSSTAAPIGADHLGTTSLLGGMNL